ncbi:hypothetical protein EIP91_002619 [Steccherinum ochraceum]|uniref:Uncharacterized protein n=1 Tax=Steccherinum ochraceum TaxID=92696 RepID=A0A4R0RX86_9APHY|nr:hypothetical protein EIP91_002619 [Steccherinum ochraceum]
MGYGDRLSQLLPSSRSRIDKTYLKDATIPWHASFSFGDGKTWWAGWGRRGWGCSDLCVCSWHVVLGKQQPTVSYKPFYGTFTCSKASPSIDSEHSTTTDRKKSTYYSSSTLVFDPIHNTTTCQNTTLTWRFSGTQDVSLTITITNTPASPGNLGISNPIALVSRVLGNDISSQAQQIVWNAVDIPAGVYQAVAFNTQQVETSPPIDTRSASFFVLAGDTSCMQAASSASNSPPSAPATSLPVSTPAVPTPTDGDGSPASDTADTQSKALSPAALAGTIVGVVAGVVLLLLAFTFPQLLRRTLPTRPSRGRRPGGPYMLF